jgi:hypothetical protein
MLTLFLSGIDGVGQNLRSIVVDDSGNLTSLNSASSDSITEDNWKTELSSATNSYWTKVTIVLLAIVALTVISGIQVFGSGLNFDAPTVVKASFGGILFALVTSDIWSVGTYIFSQGNAYIGWITMALVSTFLVGFALSLIEWIGGTD